MTNDEHSRQTEEAAIDWFAWCFWAVVLTTLLIAIVWGHAWVSAQVVP